MESISRYHLAQHECGLWHVIDAKTGGPAEVKVGEKFFALWKLPRDQAEQWSLLLNARARDVTKQ